MTARAALALDLGTKLGFAIRHADGRIESGGRDFSQPKHKGDGARFLSFRAWLHDTKRRLGAAGEQIGVIRYERVDFIVPDQAMSAHIWGGMWGTLTAWAEHHQIPYRGVAVATIKKAAAGHGRASTPEVVAAMRARGFNPATSDEAIALAVLHTSSMDFAA